MKDGVVLVGVGVPPGGCDSEDDLDEGEGYASARRLTCGICGVVKRSVNMPQHALRCKERKRFVQHAKQAVASALGR